jgi:hypothetical protein
MTDTSEPRPVGRVDGRPCTCHPDDNPPKPCARKYALCECRTADELDRLRAEVELLRAAALRQWKADAALYAMPHDCSADEHIAAMNEHEAAHAALGALLPPNARLTGPKRPPQEYANGTD